MTYIYYSNKYTDSGETMHKKLCSAFNKSWMQRCRTLDELSKRLHGPLYNVSAAILLINDRKELEVILSLKDILWDIKVIIIFSSHTDVSPLEITELRPRFITWTDSDLSHVIDVLGRIMKCEPFSNITTRISTGSNKSKMNI